MGEGHGGIALELGKLQELDPFNNQGEGDRPYGKGMIISRRRRVF